MSLPLVILGAGGFARELFGWMSNDPTWLAPIAMVQDAPGAFHFGIPVVDFDAFPFPVRFVLAVSAPDLKENLVAKALARGWEPARYIDKSSIVGLDVKFGVGTVVCPFSTISSNVVMGDYVTLNCRSSVGHESVIGDFSTLLGSNSVSGDVLISDRVTIGAGAIIHPGKSVGGKSTVGIGSVVVNNVKEGSVVFGNPAKRVALA